MVLTRTSSQEVFETINKLKSKNSGDMFELNNVLNQAVNPVICEVLSNVFNNCFDKSYFPEVFKTAKVIPIFKKGDADDPVNYRPIFFTCFRKRF